jgi:serine/threonine protein kinase
MRSLLISGRVDKRTNSKVIIVSIPQDTDEESRPGFNIKQYLSMLRGFESPYIARTLDSFDALDRTWVIMEYMGGGTLFNLVFSTI